MSKIDKFVHEGETYYRIKNGPGVPDGSCDGCDARRPQNGGPQPNDRLCVHTYTVNICDNCTWRKGEAGMVAWTAQRLTE